MLRAIRRLSTLGLVSVLLIAVMGVYLSWMRLGELADLWTPYGQRLLLKVGLVFAVLVLAAVNRWWLLPNLQAKKTRGLQTVSLEAALIVAVLGASGLLATTEPPPPPGQTVPTIVNISETLGNRRYVGQLFSQAGLIHLYLDLRDADGNLLEGGPAIRVYAQRGTEVLEDTVVPFYRSQYHSALLAERPGEWQVVVELPGKTLEFTLEVKR